MSIGIGIGYYWKSALNTTVTLSFESSSFPIFLFVAGIGFILFGAILQSIYEKQGKTNRY